MIERLLNRCFRITKKSCGAMTRWHVFRYRYWAVFVHKFTGDDPRGVMHDHTRRFTSIGLRGSYIEHTKTGSVLWRAPWVHTFPATHAHRIEIRTPTVWTLVLAGVPTRRSGLWARGKWWLAEIYYARYPEKRPC